VLGRRIHAVVRYLAVLLMACALAAPASGVPGNGNGGGNGGGNGNSGGNGNGGGNGGNGQSSPNRRGGGKKETGSYRQIKVAGYYSGSGKASALGKNVSIQAELKDPTGAKYKLSAENLTREDNHFYGPGDLSGDRVQIDGRVDPVDEDEGNGKGPVVKIGRITFTFRSETSGRGGRGVGKKSGSSGTGS